MSAAGEPTTKVNELFEQAAHLFETAVQSGIKMQEEAVRSLSAMMGGMGAPADWRKRTEKAGEKAMSVAQQNMDDAIRMMNENAKASLDLLQKAFDAKRDEAPTDSQARLREMWETTVGSLRRNTEVMLQANNRVLESWREMAGMMNGHA